MTDKIIRTLSFPQNKKIGLKLPFGLEDSVTGDTESSGLYMNGYIPVLTDLTLEYQQQFHEFQCRLPIHNPLVDPNALLVRKITYTKLQQRSVSHYEAALEIDEFIKTIPKGEIFFWHNKGFDIRLIRDNNFANLLNPYAFEVNSFVHIDTWKEARLLQCLPGNKPLKEAKSLKLNDLAEALDYHVHPAILHTASGDVSIAKGIVYRLCEEYPKEFHDGVLQKGLRLARRKQLLQKPFFWLPPYSKSVEQPPIPYMAITEHPTFANWFLCVPLSFKEFQDNAKEAIRLLKEGGNASRGLSRLIQANQETGYAALDSDSGKQFATNSEIQDLIQLAHSLKENEALIETLCQVEMDLISNRPLPEYSEQSRVAVGFPTEADKRLMERFHKAPPKDRYGLSLGFEEPVYHEFALWILLDNFPETLPVIVRQNLRKKIRERLLCTEEKAPWATIPNCLIEIDGLKSKANPAEFEILRDYEIWLQKMIRNWDIKVPQPTSIDFIPF